MHSTTLLDLPDELLIRCLPDKAISHASVMPCVAVCKKLLGVLLKDSGSGALSLQLKIRHPDDVPIRRATLQLMVKAFPDLHRLLIQSLGGGLGDQLAAVLTAPAGCDAGWLKGITRLCLAKLVDSYDDEEEQNACLYLAHPLHISVAKACPSLMELELDSIVFSDQHHHITDAPYQEKLKKISQVLSSEDPATSTSQQQKLQGMDATVEEQVTDLELPQRQHQLQAQSQEQKSAARLSELRTMEEHTVGMQGLQRQHELQVENQVPCQHSQVITGMIAAPLTLKLQQLTVFMCRLGTSASAFALQRQLQMLPSLQKLSMVHLDVNESGDDKGYSAAVADSCNSRLTFLEWHMTGAEVAAALLSKLYEQLQQLLVPFFLVDDACMELLLQHAPSLKTLQVHKFELKQDFSCRKCSWGTVVIMHYLDVVSLTRMPLGHAPKLVAGCGCLSVLLPSTEGGIAEDLNLITLGASAVEHCGGLHVPKGSALWPITVQIGGGAQACTSQVAIAMLPMLRNATRQLVLRNTEITPSLLQAISDQLPHCSQVTFNNGCTFTEGIWGSLVTLLRHVTHIDVLCETVTLHMLMVLSVMATHPVTLMVLDEVVGQDADVLEQAVRHAGHSFVTFAYEVYPVYSE